MSELIESLRKKVSELGSARYKADSSYDSRRNELIAEVDKRVEAELGPARNAARAAENEAINALKAAEDAERLAMASSCLPYPEGTILCEWDSPNSCWSSTKKMFLTGKRAVVEIFKAGDPYPSNYGRYNTPSIGSIVLRTLKKDGTKGLEVKNFNHLSRWTKDSWLPEGVEPECNKSKVP